jgi:SPP1 gp7 family putative phage head morphogenesis protein
MPQKIDLAYAIGLPPEKAIEYFKSKGYQFSWNWYDIWQEAQAKAFTVAKAMRMDILQDIHEMARKALDEGITFQQFKKELEPRLKAKGWWGYKFVSYPDGRVEKILEGSPWRLKTIYRTNLQTAYMAGRHKAFMENVDNRPYWQYIAVLDSRTRPTHRALHGKIFRYDDPFWDTHYPPLGFNCRCRVRTLSQSDVDKKDLPVDSAVGKIKWEDQLVSKKTGELQPVAVYYDSVTGMKIPTDVGWSYNPGKAAWFPDLDKYPYDVAKQWVQGGLTGPDFKTFFEGKIKGNFPVAVLDEEHKKAIKSKSQVVYLSDETLAKQRGWIENTIGHPELTLQEYQKIPSIISNGQIIIQDSDLTLVFIKLEGRFYQAVIKATRSGKTLFMVSFRRVDDIKREVERLKRKKNVKIIKDEL